MKSEPNQGPVEGTVQPGYEAVRAAFAENLALGQELGAHFAVYRNGEVYSSPFDKPVVSRG